MKTVNLKFVFVLLLSVAMIFSISACGGSDSEDAASDETSAEATEAPESTEAAAGDIVPEFTFTNTGTEEICELYLSPTGTEDWGVDQLKGQTIAAEATFTLTNIPAGSYDVKAVGCAGGEVVGQIDIVNQ